MTRRLWILGASDPEMERIENLLSSVGEAFAHATIGGARVRPDSAYKADEVTATSPHATLDAWQNGDEELDEVVLVECSRPLRAAFGPAMVVVIDHHRQGDPVGALDMSADLQGHQGINPQRGKRRFAVNGL